MLTTPPVPSGHGPDLASRRFRLFRRQLNQLWEGYELTRATLPAVTTQLQQGAIAPVRFRYFAQPGNGKPLSATDAAGAIDRYLVRTSPSHTMIQGIGYLELLFSDLAALVLHDYPARLQQKAPADENRDRKLLSIILDSLDKPEILDRVVEEKVRGITYGSPRDFFLKDSAGLHFSGHFKVKHQSDLALYEEMSARRNVWVHNDGKVDRKYLREVANSPFGLGRTASIPDNYLGDAMRVLRTLGTCVAFLTVQNNYPVAPRGELAAGFKAIHP